ncbi:MAG: metalloregulator ArsR/SmtB family transcription factor [Albidovulum sp.]|nr:metalloregulator ArsR/SmtB family transcription factor [Albidovulum sp.]
MSLAEFGRAIGHESREAMLEALMGGQALSASELAWRAGVSSQTASSHLNELVKSGLLYMRKCGRFHYFELNGDSVASFIEQLASDVPLKAGRRPRQNVKTELKKARFCYDHLAGELGVEISRILVETGALTLTRESYVLPEGGHRLYRELCVDLDEARSKRRLLCPRCVDWSERLPHVAGSLGAMIAAGMVEREFIVRSRNDRSVVINKAGKLFLVGKLGFNRSFFANAPDGGSRQSR